MVLEIAGGILLAYLAIFFVAPIFFSVLGVIMEEAVIPLCEESGKGISWLYKHCCVGIKWFINARWYYKLLVYVGLIVVISLFNWVYGFMSAIIIGIYCFAVWAMDLVKKFDNWVNAQITKYITKGKK